MALPSLSNKVFTAGILVVLCFVIAYIFTIPKWNEYRAQQANLSAALAQNQALNTALQNVQGFLDDYNAHKADVATAQSALPAQNLHSDILVSSLGDLAQASGVTLSNMDIPAQSLAGAKLAPNSIQAQSIDIAASGSYAAFKDFILRLENNIRLMDVKKISLKADETGQVKYTIEFKVYYQK